MYSREERNIEYDSVIRNVLGNRGRVDNVDIRWEEDMDMKIRDGLLRGDGMVYRRVLRGRVQC